MGNLPRKDRFRNSTKRRNIRRSCPAGDGAPAEPIDLDGTEHEAARLSERELRQLSRELRRIALRYGPAHIPPIEKLVADEDFAASQAAGYRIGERPFRALYGMARALERKAEHRLTSRRGGIDG